MAFRFGVARCCCCSVFTDEFNRADSSSLGADWSEQAGNWEIASNELTTADSNALVRCEEATDAGSHYVTVTMSSDADMDQIRVIVDYVDDNNYHFAEVETGATNSILRLYSRVAGSNTQLGSDQTLAGIATGDDLAIKVCFSSGLLSAQVGPVNNYHQESSAGGTGTKCGLATGLLAGDAVFDSFEIQTHKDTSESCPECGPVCNRCNEGSGPDHLKVVIAGATAVSFTNCCDDFNGTFIVPAVNNCRWYGEFAGADCDFAISVAFIPHPGSAGLPRISVIVERISGFPAAFHSFQESKTGGWTIDCETLEDEDVSWSSGDGSECDNAFAPTCKISAA